MSIDITESGIVVNLDEVKDSAAMLQAIQRRAPAIVTFQGNSDGFQSEIQSLAATGHNVVISGTTGPAKTTILHA